MRFRLKTAQTLYLYASKSVPILPQFAAQDINTVETPAFALSRLVEACTPQLAARAALDQSLALRNAAEGTPYN